MIEQRDRPGHALLWVLLGLVYGGTVAVLAISLSGGGHGWNFASISAVGVILVPAFGIALASPRKERRGLLWMVTAAMIIADVFLVLGTESEGWTYFESVWSRGAGYVVTWAILWFAWQLAALATLIRDVAASWRR
jgi:hypothetical protein